MDVLRDFVSTDGNNLHAFLKEWDGNTRCISSPSVGDAVRIMTVHKSKGLDFPYVIVPFLEGVGLSRYEKKWCRPDVAGTELEDVAQGIYDVNLSSKSENTLFARHYRDEVQMQFVDNINVVYVALPRAKEFMEVIAALPEDVKDAIEDKSFNETAVKDFSQLLYWYAHAKGAGLGLEPEALDADNPDSESFMCGQMPQHE